MEIIRTVTTIFMVPTLNIPKDSLKNNGFINGYIKDIRKDVQYENSVYVLFQPKNLDKFREFLNNEYDRTKAIIDEYDYEDGYVVIVYKLDSNFKKDFDLIKLGQYSNTSLEFQHLFPEKVITTQNGLRKEEFTLHHKIFNKSKDLIKYWEVEFGVIFTKNQETWEGFFEAKEILNLDKLKENVQRTVV